MKETKPKLPRTSRVVREKRMMDENLRTLSSHYRRKAA